MKVAVMGTGYVGLTTGAALAHLGHQVVCADIDEAKIALLQRGICPIYEPGLEELLQANSASLVFTTSCREAVQEAQVVFIAVGTPANEDGSPNLSYLHQALDMILDALAEITEREPAGGHFGVSAAIGPIGEYSKSLPTLLVNKSTVPVGTGDRFQEEIRRRGLEQRVELASNPEFLRQGRAMHDTLHPERIVAGGSSWAAQMLRELYAPLLDNTDIPFLHVDLKSAELAKYAANAFLAMKISFINEIANVCDGIGADVESVARIIGSDSRIGPAFLHAGIGYGGSCFPKDTRALRHIADTSGYDFRLLSAVIEVNNGQRDRMLLKLRSRLGSLNGKRIAVLGLTFKPATDDLREAPSLPVIAQLISEGAIVTAHDPVAVAHAGERLPPGVHLADSAVECLRDADAALLVTEWPEYTAIAPEIWLQHMRRPLVIDGRNALPASLRSVLEYCGMGVPSYAGSIPLAT